MANGDIPAYLKSATPNPMSHRSAWYTNTAQAYAGIFLWIAFFDQLAGTTGDKGPIALAMSGLTISLLALVVAGLLAVFLFYYVPGMLGMKTGLPLYIVGTSTFGTKGGYFLPGIFMGLLQIGWYSVGTYYAASFFLQGIGKGSLATALFDQSGQFSLVFVITAIVWGYLFAFIGALGIGYVAKVSTFFPIVPIVMLIIAAVSAAPYVGSYEPPLGPPVPLASFADYQVEAGVAGFLLLIQLVIGFFATAGAVGADFCSNNRNEDDVRWGGLVGIWLPIVFAGGLGLITVAGAHGLTTTVSLDMRGTGGRESGIERGELVAEGVCEKWGFSQDERGMIVTSVKKDSPAARAGIQVGDLIVSVAGRPAMPPRPPLQDSETGPLLPPGGIDEVIAAQTAGQPIPVVKKTGSFTFGAALPVVNPMLGKIMLLLFAIGSVASSCFCSFIIGNSLSTMLGSARTRIPLTLGGATIGIFLAALGVAGNLPPFFGLIGASFGPVIGAMIADYLRSGGRWAGPRAGVSIPGYVAWALGFLVGILGHPWVAILPSWHITSVYSLIVGFVVYYVLALIGLEPAKVDVPGLQLAAEEKT